MDTRGFLIILEGNISAGKTSLARDLGKLLDYFVFLEPTITNPYLAHFYADPPKYALVMQKWLLKQRFCIYIAAIKYLLETGRGIILDRSVFSDWVFAEKNRRDGNITEEGFQEYLEIRNNLLSHLPIPPVTIYLDVSPQECYRRVHTLRRREVESGIPQAYLAGLDDCYHEFTTYMHSQGSRVIEIEWNNFGNSTAVAQMIRREISTLPPMPLLVNVVDLTNFVYNDSLVQSVLREMQPETQREEEFLVVERNNTESGGQTVLPNTVSTIAS